MLLDWKWKKSTFWLMCYHIPTCGSLLQSLLLSQQFPKKLSTKNILERTKGTVTEGHTRQSCLGVRLFTSGCRNSWTILFTTFWRISMAPDMSRLKHEKEWKEAINLTSRIEFIHIFSSCCVKCNLSPIVTMRNPSFQICFKRLPEKKCLQ